MIFIDPEKPLATCETSSCDGCAVATDLQCHFGLQDLTYFLLISLPSFLVGAPKFWPYRPGPMTITEKFVFLGGFVLVWGYPLYFLVVGGQLLLLAVYVMTTAGFFLTMRKLMCSRCINFACPLNTVDAPTREAFRGNNPTIAQAWRGTGKNKTAEG